MTKRVTFRFSCPACGEPWAHTTQDLVDIHAGTVYTCAECGAAIEFTAEATIHHIVEAEDAPDLVASAGIATVGEGGSDIDPDGFIDTEVIKEKLDALSEKVAANAATISRIEGDRKAILAMLGALCKQ